MCTGSRAGAKDARHGMIGAAGLRCKRSALTDRAPEPRRSAGVEDHSTLHRTKCSGNDGCNTGSKGRATFSLFGSHCRYTTRRQWYSYKVIK
jgi:hypothetical protein